VSATRIAPAWFRAELLRRFGSGHDAVWDPVLSRWVIVSPSAAGYPTRQVVVWRRDPATDKATRPDVAGLLPVRELDDACCWEIIRNMERSALTNRVDGAGTWKQQVARTTETNNAVQAAHVREAAENFAYALTQVDLRRPWLKHHSGSKNLRRVAQRAR